jgi:hypothetical protein
MLQINSSDPMALRPKKRNEMTTDEPTRAGYQTPNLGAQFVFPLTIRNGNVPPNSAKL